LRKTIITLFVFLFAIILVIGTVLAVPKLRSSAYRALPELVEYGFRGKLRYFVQNRIFESANRTLLTQINAVEWFSSQRNVLLPGLVANAEYVLERIRDEKDYSKLAPFLTRLAEANPDLLPAHLWLARANALNNPDISFKHLQIAERLAPAEGRIYRIALETALLHNLPDKQRDWCQRYRQARQFGGPHPYEYEPMFRGVGERKLAIDAVFENGRSQLVDNFGLQLDKQAIYSFNLEPGTLQRLRVHLGIGAGYMIKFGDLGVYQGGVKRTLPAGDLFLTSWSGYVPPGGEIYTASADGSTITIHVSSSGLGAVDRLDLSMRVNRLPPVSLSVCAKR